MTIIYRSEFPERARLAIAHYYGEPGLASRKTCLSWMQSTVNSTLDQLVWEMDKSAEEG